MSTITNFDNILCIFLLVAPILWLPGITQNGLQNILFNFGGLILFSLAVYCGFQRKTNNFFIPAVLILSVILALWINPKAYPLGFISLTSGVLFYCAIVLAVKDGRKIIWILAAISGINIIFALSQYLGLNIVYERTTNNMSIFNSHFSMPGLMARNYHLSYSLIFIAPLCFIINKWVGRFAIIIASIFCFMVESYACKIALAAMLLTLLVPKIGMRNVLIFLIIGISIVGFFKQDRIAHKLNVRAQCYNTIVKESMVNIFKGHGIGALDIDKRIYDKNSDFESSFNQYLRLIYEVGLVPFLIMAYAVFRYFSSFKSKNIYFLASIAAILIYPMFHEVLRFARFDILIITVIALFEISCIDRETILKGEMRYANKN